MAGLHRQLQTLTSVAQVPRRAGRMAKVPECAEWLECVSQAVSHWLVSTVQARNKSREFRA